MSSVRYDVLIVGGGFIGSLAAFHLARAGARVLVIDQGEFNRQASGRNAGSLHFQLEHRLLKPGGLSLEAVGRLLPLSLAAIDDWADLASQLGTDIGIRIEGGIVVGESQTDLQKLEQKQDFEQQHGLPVQMLSRRELHRLAPYLGEQINAAVWCAADGQADPRLVTPACINAAIACGARFAQNTVLTELVRNSHWQAKISGANGDGHGKPQTVEALQVLNAAGAWAADVARLAGFEFPMHAVALQVNVTDRSNTPVPHLVQHVSRHLSLKQTHAGNFLIGGGWPAKLSPDIGQQISSLRPELVEANVIANLEIAAHVVPQIAHRRLIRTWTGIASVTPDELPLLGEAPKNSGFYFAGGGSAFTLGPTLARLIAEEMLTGTSDMNTSLFDPMRFSTSEHHPQP